MRYSPRQRTGVILYGSAMLLIVLACTCGPLQQVQQVQGTVGAAKSTLEPALTQLKQDAPTFEALASQLPLTLTASGADINQLGGTMAAGASSAQYAISATASTQFGDTSWSATQATGAPNTQQCGDNGTAWASKGTNTTDTLTLKYASAVVPTSIVIYQTFNPGSVVKVEVSGPVGGATTVFEGKPAAVQDCPYQQTIDISLGKVTTPVDTVTITVDQSVIGNWDEIDAVQLSGVGQ